MLLQNVQVDFAVSDAELEMRDGASDLYSAILVDPRTWAEKGNRAHGTTGRSDARRTWLPNI